MLACAVPGTRYTVPGARSSRLEYVPRVLVSYNTTAAAVRFFFQSRAHPHFPPQFRRRRLQDFVYLSREHTKNLVGRQITFFSGRQVEKRIFANTLKSWRYYQQSAFPFLLLCSRLACEPKQRKKIKEAHNNNLHNVSPSKETRSLPYDVEDWTYQVCKSGVCGAGLNRNME